MKPRQESFLPKLGVNARAEHGGDIAKGRRKSRRPLDPKRPIHLTLRSSQARGEWSLLKHEPRIHLLILKLEHRYGVRVYRHANVGNHLHLLLKTPSRTAFQGFLRELSGRIAMMVTGAVKGRGVASLSPAASLRSGAKRFWDRLAYSRVLSWGREFERLQAYLIKNVFEAVGLYGPREKAAGLRVMRLARAGPTHASRV